MTTESHNFIDEIIGDGYRIIGYCGSGATASVFRARRDDEIQDERAIKFIPYSQLRLTWQKEINKVTRLGTTEGVVPYFGHDDIEIDGVKYRWIAWAYIKGRSLKDIIQQRAITIPILCDVIKRVLTVLHACQVLQIEHGDLHEGNILIEDPNPLHINQEVQKVWITDFGYLSNSMGREMLDDFIGLQGVIKRCLAGIDYHSLEGNDKKIYSHIKNELSNKMHETNHVEGEYVRNPRNLMIDFNYVLQDVSRESIVAEKHVGDYLAAEVLGNRYEEWREIFVPAIVGAEKLLSKNIAVLTGLRGCGKTTIFRRLTAIYDIQLGIPNIPGAGEFLGFYFNARNLAEAFPWLPDDKKGVARPRIIHYFNCCWIIEILDWIWSQETVHAAHLWLTPFIKDIYGDRLLVTESEYGGIHHLRSFMTKERERSRLSGTYETDTFWPLDRIDFLEQFTILCMQNLADTNGKVFYFWVDDYSTPLVTPLMQEILNAVIFRRSSNAIFKIATESIESIELIGLHGKVLEQDDDFVLIDLGTEAIQRSSEDNREIILSLLQPRIQRDQQLREKDISIQELLGETGYKYTELALALRGDETHKKQKVKYHGVQTFCDLWSSSTRELIILFAEMVEQARSSISNYEKDNSELPVVKIIDQDRLIRTAGSRFRSLLAAASNPTRKVYELTGDDKSFGEHLQKILDAFCEIAEFELQTKNSTNEGRTPPKQARRIEITNTEETIPDSILPYYKAIIRYGIFIRDIRGKSARGKAVPRLILRSVLIPYYTLSFSKRDSIMMSWDQFCSFLSRPKLFADAWKKTPKADIENTQDNIPGLTQ